MNTKMSEFTDTEYLEVRLKMVKQDIESLDSKRLDIDGMKDELVNIRNELTIQRMDIFKIQCRDIKWNEGHYRNMICNEEDFTYNMMMNERLADRHALHMQSRF
jgi:hypothetical protein